MIVDEQKKNRHQYDTQSDADKREGARIVARWGVMDAAAINWKLHWQHCYEYIVPRKEDVTVTRMPGDEREVDIYDTTAVHANEQLSAALHSMLTNPEVRFFEILFGDPKIDEDTAVKQWAQQVADRMYQILNSSNFQTEIFEIYIDLGAAGTACLFMGDDEEYSVMFSARALKEIRIDEDFSGMVDTVYRTYKLTAAKIIQQFEKDGLIPREIYEAAEKDSTDQIDILHAVEPLENVTNEESRSMTEAKGHDTHSTFLIKDKNYILSKGSFHEFPYAVPRWSKTTGELYGRGPGFQMLGDIRMVNAMMLTVIQGAQKTVDPPLQVEDDGVIGQVRLTPAGLTVIRPGSAGIKPLITDARIDFGQKMLEDVRSRIRAGFYIDQLTLPKESPQRTAEEVRQIAEEQMRLMGPVLGRQHFELLRPLITRVFGIMNRKKMFPDAPQKIVGKNFDVKYSSLIARAQQLQMIQGISRALGVMQPLIELKPDMVDILKTDDLSRKVWDVCGNPANLLETPRDLKSMRDKQDQAKQQAAQQAQQLNGSQVSKNTAPMVQQLAQAQQQGQSPGAPPVAPAGPGQQQ
jgi:Bacteriophage head to tail connecting protein